MSPKSRTVRVAFKIPEVRRVRWAKRSVPTPLTPRSLSDRGHGASRLCSAYGYAALLRCDLAWRGRRADEVGGQLRVACLGVLHGLLLDRGVAAAAGGQRANFDGGVVRHRRQQAEHGGDVLFVAGDQVALELAVGAVAENVERRATQEAQFCQRAEHRHHPGAERALLRPAERILSPAEDRRRQIEVELELALELIAELFFELAVGEQPRDFVLVLVGEQLGVVDRDRARQRLAVAAVDGGVADALHEALVAFG